MHRQTTLCVHVYEEIYGGYEESSENCTFKSRLSLNTSIKLYETLIDSCMVFLRLPGPSKAKLLSSPSPAKNNFAIRRFRRPKKAKKHHT